MAFPVDAKDVGFSHLFPGSMTRAMQDKASYDVPISLDDACGSDDSSKAMWAFDALRGGKFGQLIFPPRVIDFKSQVTFDLRGFADNIQLIGYGARITTKGAISALRLQGTSVPQQVSVEGLTINHRNNPDATAGLDISGAGSVAVEKVTVVANDTNADWAAVRLNMDAESYWTVIDQLHVRKFDGADPGAPAAGVRIEGGSNATSVMRSSFNNCVDGGLLVPHPKTRTVANSVQFFRCYFEQCEDGVHCDMDPASVLFGFELSHSRFELITGFGLNLTGSTTQNAQTILPLYGPNVATGMPAPLNNPNKLKIVDLTGLGGIGDVHLLSRGTPRIRNYSGAGWGLELWAADGAQMLAFLDAAGNQLGAINPNAAGNGIGISGTNNGTVDLLTARGISQTATRANNLRGQATLLLGRASVNFAVAEPDTRYFIALSGNKPEEFFWSKKTRSGFKIGSSNPVSSATVDWHLIR